ncbi:MAG: UDP-N-acetylglucosamine 2-epimerase (non-hydrolyzing) [bacterium]
MSKKIGIILGTRPEIIKLSSIIRYCNVNKLNYFIIHTNQHYSENMDTIFFNELNLPKPKYNLEVGSGTHGKMSGKMIIEIEKILLKEKPEIILIQGDTNTVMSAAVVAAKINIKIGHVEAGLRSYDRTMPEELNRIITDQISDYLFCPTKKQMNILLKEGVKRSKIFITGNTIVDAVKQCEKMADKKSFILKKINITTNNFILLTIHRPATTDNKKNLNAVIKGVQAIAQKNNQKIIFPTHPRTKKMIKQFKIKIPKEFILIEPIGYIDMLKLQKESFLIFTDSGGIQEESCILKKKCVTLRENTERPETITVGGCVLAGNTNSKNIIKVTEKIINKKINWKNPFGDGKSGEKIIKIMLAKIK